MSRRNSGFTLIELLVVIAIIAILAAILFPVFARAREKAIQTTCLNNVKQLTLGIMMYNSDYDQFMPPSLASWSSAPGCFPSWRADIYPYVKNLQLFQCPARLNLGNSAETAPGATAAFPEGYGINADDASSGHPVTGLLSNFGTLDGPQSQAVIGKPAETILIAETNCTGAPSDVFPYLGQGPSSACTNIAAPHSGQSNYGFCDGHAKALKPTATDPLNGQNMWSVEDDTGSSGSTLMQTLQAAEACSSNN
jgi:prepilin-type N-terminal cleavage/methylation domain-containing protein/prepilin-type processing-associated H-X9-DG protein